MAAVEVISGEQARKKRKSKQPVLEDMVMDITPMIDVVFQLLIFFMVATKFKTLEGKMLAYLPKDKSTRPIDPPPPEVLPIRVTLTWNVTTRQAKVYVGQTFTGIADQGGLSAAKRRVRQILSAGTEKAEIDADPGIPYRYVVETLNMLIASRTKEISFAGRPG
ncbi:MAG: ExbD/TolR family protein [Planctomycetota bacterium]|jgi:biopolymer transport protein ExbD